MVKLVFPSTVLGAMPRSVAMVTSSTGAYAPPTFEPEKSAVMYPSPAAFARSTGSVSTILCTSLVRVAIWIDPVNSITVLPAASVDPVPPVNTKSRAASVAAVVRVTSPESTDLRWSFGEVWAMLLTDHTSSASLIVSAAAPTVMSATVRVVSTTRTERVAEAVEAVNAASSVGTKRAEMVCWPPGTSVLTVSAAPSTTCAEPTTVSPTRNSTVPAAVAGATDALRVMPTFFTAFEAGVAAVNVVVVSTAGSGSASGSSKVTGVNTSTPADCWPWAPMVITPHCCTKQSISLPAWLWNRAPGMVSCSDQLPPASMDPAPGSVSLPG